MGVRNIITTSRYFPLDMMCGIIIAQTSRNQMSTDAMHKGQMEAIPQVGVILLILLIQSDCSDIPVTPIESFPDQKLGSSHHGDSWTNKPTKRDDRVPPLSPHQIMLIRPRQALSLTRNNRKLLTFNYIFRI